MERMLSLAIVASLVGLAAPGVARAAGVISELGGCKGCDLDEKMCRGTNKGPPKDWGLQCVTVSRACSEGDFKQCVDPASGDCDYYQRCQESGLWGDCIRIPEANMECDLYWDESEMPVECFFPSRDVFKIELGAGSLSCTTGTTDDPNPDGKEPDLAASFNTGYPRVEGDELVIKGQVCNQGEGQAKGSRVEVSFSTGEIEAETYTIDALSSSGSGRCDDFGGTFDLSDLPEKTITVYAEADAAGEVTESDEDNNRAKADFTVGQDGPADATKLEIRTLDCAMSSDGDEVECQVKICYLEDEVDPDEVSAGVYLGQDEEPGCGEEPGAKGEQWRLSDGDGEANCRDQQLELPLPKDSGSRIEIVVVSDVQCEVLDEGERGRVESTTVRSDEKRDDPGDASETSSGCRLVGTPLLPPLSLGLLLVLVIAVRHRARRR